MSTVKPEESAEGDEKGKGNIPLMDVTRMTKDFLFVLNVTKTKSYCRYFICCNKT